MRTGPSPTSRGPRGPGPAAGSPRRSESQALPLRCHIARFVKDDTEMHLDIARMAYDEGDWVA